ncbi:MAG TPA: 3-deoxy-7-phosphoheptulonate synthase [Chloroflexota bacterium]|jgi:3-deoxy-7-phosphoheptulonate synthase|nr:3-deoxy-7-phosphoheptulonate synthase [Chloroflexota bacterium]
MREYRLASREHRATNTVVRVGDPSAGPEAVVEIGGPRVAMMVGPCAVESHAQVIATAVAVREAGFPILRGGAFKPRTSPYSFQGLMDEGLRLLDAARRETGLRIVTEVMSEADVDAVARVADVLQIGSRSMHAVRLLEAIADAGKPVLLKRGFNATIKEWLLAAEYVLRRNEQLILCERGIRSFDDEFTRNVLDLGAVAVAKRETHLPVIVDPSQATGRADLVIPMCRAAIAAGADGLLIETHPDPREALCDGEQSLPTSELPRLAREVERMAQAMGRSIYPAVESLPLGAEALVGVRKDPALAVARLAESANGLAVGSGRGG